MNPDAIPIRKGWLDALDVAFQLLPRGKSFLGCHLTGEIPHMAAVGVYPQNTEALAPGTVSADQNPFNLNGAPQIVPLMAQTGLIVDSRDEPWNEEPHMFGVMQSAVLWHGSASCKDGSIYSFLDRCGHMEALPLQSVPEKPPEPKSQRFSVPTAPMSHDDTARRAAGLAGTKFTEEMPDTAPMVSKVKPPTVNPLVESERASISQSEIKATVTRLADPYVKAELDKAAADWRAEAMSVMKPEELANALAKRSNASPAGRAEVAAALRKAGFRIAGKGK
jgi:hypothetical protein